MRQDTTQPTSYWGIWAAEHTQRLAARQGRGRRRARCRHPLLPCTLAWLRSPMLSLALCPYRGFQLSFQAVELPVRNHRGRPAGHRHRKAPIDFLPRGNRGPRVVRVGIGISTRRLMRDSVAGPHRSQSSTGERIGLGYRSATGFPEKSSEHGVLHRVPYLGKQQRRLSIGPPTNPLLEHAWHRVRRGLDHNQAGRNLEQDRHRLSSPVQEFVTRFTRL